MTGRQLTVPLSTLGLQAKGSGRFAGAAALTVDRARREIWPTVPRTVSERRVLRDGLPALYAESDFTMRFVEAFEQVLDPVGATLDSLHRLLDPAFAPAPMLRLMCAWLGMETDENPGDDRLRELTRRAFELHGLRGTRRGLELALQLGFPDLHFRVEDEAAVTWPGGPAASAGAHRFVVRCETAVSEERQVAIARCVEREKPAHTTYRLRFKSRKGAA